ncbi:unnamed protein product [Chrysoparadoxa australica]
MLHRAIFGSVERFFGILIEDTAGDFPLWLAPTQLKLLPVTDVVRDYCFSVKEKFAKAGIRVDVDMSGESRLAKQIRNAEQQRMPIMCVVGEKEVEAGELAVRSRKAGDLGTFDVDALLALISKAADDAVELHQVVPPVATQ